MLNSTQPHYVPSTIQVHSHWTLVTLAILTLVDKVKWWHILLTVIAAFLCIPGVLLWIAVGVVVSEPPGGSK